MTMRSPTASSHVFFFFFCFCSSLLLGLGNHHPFGGADGQPTVVGTLGGTVRASDAGIVQLGPFNATDVFARDAGGGPFVLEAHQNTGGPLPPWLRFGPVEISSENVNTRSSSTVCGHYLGGTRLACLSFANAVQDVAFIDEPTTGSSQFRVLGKVSTGDICLTRDVVSTGASDDQVVVACAASLLLFDVSQGPTQAVLRSTVPLPGEGPSSLWATTSMVYLGTTSGKVLEFSIAGGALSLQRTFPLQYSVSDLLRLPGGDFIVSGGGHVGRLNIGTNSTTYQSLCTDYTIRLAPQLLAGDTLVVAYCANQVADGVRLLNVGTLSQVGFAGLFPVNQDPGSRSADIVADPVLKLIFVGDGDHTFVVDASNPSRPQVFGRARVAARWLGRPVAGSMVLLAGKPGNSNPGALCAISLLHYEMYGTGPASPSVVTVPVKVMAWDRTTDLWAIERVDVIIPARDSPASASSTGSSAGDVGLLVGIIVAAAAVCLLVSAAAAFVVWRRRQDSDGASSEVQLPDDSAPSYASEPSYVTTNTVTMQGDNEYQTTDVPSGGEYQTSDVYNTVDDVPSGGEYNTVDDVPNGGGEYNTT
jgi:hypothetical protein